MIDLHSHILPNIDDGATDLQVAIEMARIAVADGITHMACTPHIYPGKYENSSVTILPAIQAFQKILDEKEIALKLVCGADVHIAINIIDRIQVGEIPTLNNSRYFLLEPPHMIMPPRLVDYAASILKTGIVPIITHPERLIWADRHYDIIKKLADIGCPLQITAGSILGEFGRIAQNLALQILEDGCAGFFASDAHGINSRRPELSRAHQFVAQEMGVECAHQLFIQRPARILENATLELPKPAQKPPKRSRLTRNLIKRIFKNG